ncbi:MAG: flippase-like domain-containing protein, partial [Muribaculaceae bacterium]|nr:flippase-like domain-containing protein [Muribaculaceae bacterium]
MEPAKQTPRPRRALLARALKLAIPAVVSVGLCVVMFRDIDFGAMVEIIRRDCRFGWIALNLALGIPPMSFRALRWRLQLRVIGCRPPLRALVCSMFGTYAVNLVFPRLGEVWRTGYIAQRQGTTFTTVFGSMVA